jgi:hypothetical protein
MILPFKISIFLHHKGSLPAWETEMFRKLRDQGTITIIAFIKDDPRDEIKSSFGLKLFQRFENGWFRSIPDAFERIPVRESFPAVSIFDKNDVPATSQATDILYCSCLTTLPVGWEAQAKYGCWYFSFGSGRYREARPYAFWELLNGEPGIGSRLLVKQSASLSDIVVYDGSTPTVPFSVKNSLNGIAWKSSSYFQYRIGELNKIGPEKFFKDYDQARDTEPGKQAFTNKTPTSFQAARLFLKNGLGYLWSKWFNNPAKKKFTISVSVQKFETGRLDLSKFKSFELPPGVFWADPFIIEKEGKDYVFFEEFLYKENRGRISVMQLTGDGHTMPVPVLDKPYHLSYPFIFEFKDETYMIPESSENKTVELYRCIEFPYKWEFVKNLMEDILVIDATVLFHNGKWWLFGTGTSKSFLSSNDQLFLYHSDDLFSSQWTPHPGNPIATRVSNCRPAGRIFRSGEKLYRPAQNNASRQYGYAIKINEIEVLNEMEYCEKEVADIIPDGTDFLAIHTINFTGKTIVIDSIRC